MVAKSEVNLFEGFETSAEFMKASAEIFDKAEMRLLCAGAALALESEGTASTGPN
jgi:hypothetical protein